VNNWFLMLDTVPLTQTTWQRILIENALKKAIKCLKYLMPYILRFCIFIGKQRMIISRNQSWEMSIHIKYKHGRLEAIDVQHIIFIGLCLSFFLIYLTLLEEWLITINLEGFQIASVTLNAFMLLQTQNDNFISLMWLPDQLEMCL